MPTPNTFSYMILGYAVAFVTMGIYIVSLYIRNHNLKRDLETLESLQTEEKPTKKK